MRRINFYREGDGRWYADIQEYLDEGGCKSDLELVAGANIWLEVLAERSNKVELEVNITSPHTSKALYKLCEDSGGAVYFLNDNPDFLIWLCPVLKYIYGIYPDNIYYDVIKD